MNNESDLKAKDSQIILQFNEQNSSYQANLSLINTSQQRIFFKVFFHNLNDRLLPLSEPLIKQVQPLKTVILSLKLKIPNQIKKQAQSICISYSNRQISERIKCFEDKQLEVRIRFDQKVPDLDQVIAQILQADCQELCQEAAQTFKKGLIKSALYKYEESFLLFRQFGQGLYGMAECLYLMQNWYQALEAIQTALLINHQQRFLWLKLKIVFQIYKDKPSNLYMIRSLIKQIQSLTAVQSIQQQKKEILIYLEAEYDKINGEKGGKLMFEFIQKAISNYDTSKLVSQAYSDRKLFEKQLHEVLKIGTQHSIQQTPEFVLDPITYELMKEPVIVPSGHSYERKSLLTYIQKHGNKDLYTRQQLRYEWARPNLALQKYINTNSQLKNWISYENQITDFK